MPTTKEVIVLYTDDGMGNSIGKIVGEVVRCKDCAHSVPAIIDGQRKCELLPMVFFEDDYCSMGERREDA